jgi:hypothetical protein
MSKEAELRESLWNGVPFKEALQDAMARFSTGYKYQELKEIVADEDNEDMLQPEELTRVDKQVNLLLHMFVFYHSHQTDKQS